MPCIPFKTADGATGIMCVRGSVKRCACGAMAEFECDWKVKSRHSGTCDAHICARCRTNVAEEVDLCKTHAATWVRLGKPRNGFKPPATQMSLFGDER